MMGERRGGRVQIETKRDKERWGMKRHRETETEMGGGGEETERDM